MGVARYLRFAIDKVQGAGRMAFIGGPRQVGKTTLALELLGAEATEQHPGYLNWDAPAFLRGLRRGELPPRQPGGETW
jgi:AAA+ ATPase superfamily predicted ATPase